MPPEYIVTDEMNRPVSGGRYNTPNETGSFKARPIDDPTASDIIITQTISPEGDGVHVSVNAPRMGKQVYGVGASFEPGENLRRIYTGGIGEKLTIDLGVSAATLRRQLEVEK